MPPRRGTRSPSVIECLLGKRHLSKLSQSHLSQRHDETTPPVLRLLLPILAIPSFFEIKVDAWIAKQREPDLSRPEAVRRLIELGLRAKK
jgi:hypothetical protein